MILTSESTARLPLLDAMLPAGARFGLVGKSDSLKRVFDLMDQVGPTDATILITGETGTGKEIVARGIHQLSPRAKAPFLCCNCPAIPESLVESELFGYSKGAFTGAYAQQDGLITQANGGTLFFDELGEMNPLAQAKILRTLETGEVQPLGSSKTVHVEVRLISATHRNLGQMVAENSFRRDLLFRVNAVELHLPPLRERKEDIPLLIDHFIDVFNREHASGPQGRDPVAGVTPGAMRLLCGHDWPGNIRQLRNVIEGAFLLAPGPWISVQDLCQLHWSLGSPARHQYTVSSSAPSYQHISNEPDRLLAALQATRWNKSKTAEILHWSRMTVYRKIARYGLEP